MKDYQLLWLLYRLQRDFKAIVALGISFWDIYFNFYSRKASDIICISLRYQISSQKYFFILPKFSNILFIGPIRVYFKIISSKLYPPFIMNKTDSQKLIEHFQVEDPRDFERNSTSQQFNNSFQYFISVVGVAVGYGSFWRFPYIMYENGGGAFLIPYTLSFILVGIPMLYLQTAVGHMHQVTAPLIFEKIHKGLKVLGMAIVFVLLNVAGFYNLLLTYSYRYFISAFQYPLPYANQSATELGYFQTTVLNKSESINDFGGVQWSLYAIYLVSLAIIYYIIRNGVKFSGKVATYTALAPYIFFVVLVIRGFMLPGGYEGFMLCITPNFDKLVDPQAWIAAVVQVFFQMGLGCGVLINMASLKPRNQSSLKGLFIIPFSVYFCGLLCAICVYMYVNYEAKLIGVSFYDLKLSGLQLSFNVFPKALATLPLSNIWVVLFYFGMICLGIDSMFGAVQSLVSYISDEMRFDNFKPTFFSKKLQLKDMKILVLVFCAVLGILYTSRAGIHYLNFVNKFLLTAPLTINAVIEYYLFVKIFPVSELAEEEERNTGERVSRWVLAILQSKFMHCFLIFNLVLAIIAEFVYIHQYPWKFAVLGVFIGMFMYVWSFIYWWKRKNGKWRLNFDSNRSLISQ